ANDDPAAPGPSLASVLGYVINLPRDGRFVDQLYAIEQAQRRASVSASAQPSLLRGDWPALEAVARALLPTYRRRRSALALEIDLLRQALAAATTDEQREAVLAARLTVDAQLALLTHLRETAEGILRAEIEGGIEPLTAIEATDNWARSAVYTAVAAATDAFV